MSTAILEAADEQRLLALLPWYCNGTLATEERRWLEACVARSERAASLLAREQALAASVVAQLAPAPEDIGLAQTLSRLRAQQAPARRDHAVGAQAASAWSGLGARLASWMDVLVRPRVAGAMAMVLLVQLGVLGWLLERPQAAMERVRSLPVQELRTLRVSFVKGITEEQIRVALVAAGAHIVGGPSQVGEYWLASSMVSVEEMRAALEKSGVLANAEPDTVGPR